MKKLKNLKSFFISKMKKSSNAFVISVFLIFIFIMSATALAVWMNWKSSVSYNKSKGVKEYLIGEKNISDKQFLKKPIKLIKPTELTSVEISNLIDKSKAKTNEEKTFFNIIPKVLLDGWDRSKNFVYKEECQKEKEFANGSLGYCDVKNSVNSIFILWKKEDRENTDKKFMDGRIFVNVFEFPDETYAFSENIVKSYYLSSQLRKLYTITLQDKIIQRYEMMKMYKLKESDSGFVKEYFYLDTFSIDKFVITLFYNREYQDQADNITRETILRNIDHIKK